jgi:hypothetical protein
MSGGAASVVAVGNATASATACAISFFLINHSLDFVVGAVTGAADALRLDAHATAKAADAA